ncbi:helix-turn-helix domain-containing protein [Sulfolobus sp. E5-1-F]|uniref:helix-turn-helix transcriptional regulator n=1 Tax=Saccharolobus sp. E5-1-F TaxID=2663019 RepID=UPI0012950C83|nr:helix-turn-helix domain-containing protein [Sulfolobus sp. E5-1-F]QGA55281.1 helix-turn-helix domain-containing protein [Sulfolobus sp. E5-1-F]
MKILLLLLLPLITVPVIISHSSVLNIYYNGTVEAELSGNVNQFVLIGHNITNLKVIGAKYNLSGNILYLTPTTTNTTVFIYYNAILPKGVIQINEHYNATINVYLPLNSSISYISPQPYSFNIIGNNYNITFINTNNVILLYTFSSHISTTQNEIELPIIIGGLIGSDAALITLILFLLRRKSVEIKEEEESVDFVPEVLDERDTIVLEAIKMGTNTLAEIVRQTGLPKSTAYRRVKKLVKLGYIEEIREEGKIRYVVKSDKK